jgi:hypothetical protein
MGVRAVVSALLLGSCALAADLPPGLDPVKAGQELAAELRNAVPDESAEFTGTLKIRKSGVETEVPIASKVDVCPTGWTVTYETKAGGPHPPQRLVIEYKPDKPPVYRYAEGKDLKNLRELKLHELTVPLAGSDFYLMDLGLQFLHWPTQRLAKIQMRKNRSCRVLESINPKPQIGGYSRVLSWIDVETSGLIIAEAYDETGKDFKRFELDSVKKHNGKWQVRDVEMYNLKAKTRTKLQFDLK